jgi:hypothetical protein
MQQKLITTRNLIGAFELLAVRLFCLLMMLITMWGLLKGHLAL